MDLTLLKHAIDATLVHGTGFMMASAPTYQKRDWFERTVSARLTDRAVLLARWRMLLAVEEPTGSTFAHGCVKADITNIPKREPISL